MSLFSSMHLLKKIDIHLSTQEHKYVLVIQIFSKDFSFSTILDLRKYTKVPKCLSKFLKGSCVSDFVSLMMIIFCRSCGKNNWFSLRNSTTSSYVKGRDRRRSAARRQQLIPAKTRKLKNFWGAFRPVTHLSSRGLFLSFHLLLPIPHQM